MLKEKQSQILTRKIRQVTIVGILSNIILAAGKIIIGIFSYSQALIADGVHSLSDLVTDMTILIGAGYWNAPADKKHPYGHGRIETLINIGIGFILCSVGIGIGYDAIVTIGAPNNVIPGWDAFIMAVVSIIIKESLFRWTAFQGRKLRSRAVVANAWHHRSDAFSSFPVAIAIIAAHIVPEMHYLDHVAAVIVTGMIIRASWNIALPAFKEILECRANEELEKRVAAHVQEIRDIREIHAVRSRRVGGAILVDLHLLVSPDMSVADAHEIAKNFKNHLISTEDKIADVVIHLEPYEPDKTQVV